MTALRHTVTALASTIVIFAAAATAHAAGWVTGQPLSPANAIATDPQIALTPGGERIVAWRDVLANGTPQSVSVRVAAAGTDFGAVQAFPGNAGEPHLMSGPDGVAAIAWIDTTTRAIHIARRLPGQPGFTEAAPLLTPGAETPIELSAALSGDEVIVTFASFSQQGSNIWAASLLPPSSTVQLIPGSGIGASIDHGAVTAQGGTTVSDPAIAVSGGDPYLTWQQTAPPPALGAASPITVRLAKRVRGGAVGQFGAPSGLDTIQDRTEAFARPQVAAGGGHVYVAWLRPDTAGHGVVAYQDVTHDAVTHTVSTDPGFEQLMIGSDTAGELVFTGRGTETFSAHSAVGVAVLAPGATSGQAGDITPAGAGRQPEALAVAADGRAVVLPDRFLDAESQTVQVQAALRAPGGGFGGLEDVSGVQDGGVGDGGSNAAVAILPGGRAVAAWLAADRTGAVNDRVRVSERDATPPMISALSVPSSAAAGTRVTLSASALDALSGPATISWGFGDGSGAVGAFVSHTFASPGHVTVTATATDAAGNSLRQTRVMTVEPASAARDRIAPRLSRVGFAPARFRVARAATALLAAHRGVVRGTVLRLTLNKPATIVIDVRRGRRSVGSFARLAVPAGARRIAFSGRIGGRALAPGAYTAAITAIDAVGHRARRTVTCTVVRS
jgi:hypothetical protein